MDPLKGRVTNEQMREQELITKLAPDIEAANGVLGTKPGEIENDIRNTQGNYKLFGFIPTPVDADIDPEEASDYIKSRVAEKMIGEYQKYVDEGGMTTDEDDQMIQAIKDKYALDNTFVDVAQQAAGDTWKGITQFWDQAKETVSTEEGRKGLLDSVGSALEKGVKNPGEFLDSLATLSADAIVDELPTGIFKTASDINDALHGGRVQSPTNLKVDLIKNSPFSGHTTEKLNQAQPAAAFVAMVVPYLLRGGLTKAREANALRIAGINPSKVSGTLAKAAKLATSEAVFDAGTASAGTNTEGTLRERNKARATNMALTFFSTLGIDLAGGQIQKIYKGFKGEGLNKTEAVQATIEEVQNELHEVQIGDKPIDIAKVHETLEKHAIDPEAITAKQVGEGKGRTFVAGTGEAIQRGERKALPAGTAKDSEIHKMNAKQLQKALGDTAGMERRLRAIGHTEKEAQSRVQQAKKLIQKRTSQLLTADESRNLIKKTKQILTETADDVATQEVKRDASNIGRTVSESEARALANEKAVRTSMAKKVKEVQARRAKNIKETTQANTKAKVDMQESLEQSGIPKTSSDDMVQPVDSNTIPFDGNFMDQVTARTGRFGLAGLNVLREQTPRLRETINTYVEAFSTDKRFIREANEGATKIYDDFGKSLGMTPKEATEQYLDSGMYRAWAEKLMPESQLKPSERAAFKQLKEAEVAYNKLNLELIEANGVDTSKFNPEAFTDATRGDKFVTIELTDNPELTGQVEKSGLKPIEVGPTKQNPDIKPRKFVVVDYGNSGKEILEKVDNARFYYEKKAPYMFDEKGNLRKEIFQENHNISRQLYELSQETSLTPEQLSNIKGQLLEAGYPSEEIREIMGDVSSGNVDLSGLQKKLKKMFVGSLKRDEAAKIGIQPDVVNARRLQNIQLSKKLYRDTMNNAIAEQQSNLNKFIVANPKLTDNQRWLLDSEKHSLNALGDMVNNRPDPIERLILQGMDNLGISHNNKLYKGWRNVTDQFLHVQSALKLAYNVSGSGMNVLEAIRATGDAAIEIPDKTWNVLFKSVEENPVGFVRNTEKKMAASPKYSEFYLENQYDASVDTRFKGKKNLSTHITDNGVVKVGMQPFTGSIRWGKVYAYNIGEALAETKGLTGQAKDDFIFNFMSKRGQIADLSVSAYSKSGTVVKSAFWLKNFMFRTAEFEIDAWRRLGGSVAKKSISKEAAAQAFAFTVVPTALFGVGASPSLSILNSMVSGATGTANWISQLVSGGEAPNIHIDPIRDAQTAKPGSLAGFAGRGVVGELLGMSTKQMEIDPISGFGQQPIPVQFGEDVANVVGKQFFNTGLAFETGDLNTYVGNTLENLNTFAAKEITAYGRAKKAAGVAYDGILRSINGKALESGINENERPVRAAATAMGYNTATADREYAKQQKAREVLEGKAGVKKLYIEQIAKLYNTGQDKKAEELIQIAERKGYIIGDKAIDNAIEKNKKTSTQIFRENLSEEQTAQLEKDAPETLDNPEDDDDTDD